LQSQLMIDGRRVRHPWLELIRPIFGTLNHRQI